ncbi:MAG TPA: SCO family protein [Bacteroidia bacterium]|nr:SCO family protein [Bacteroidia bacterium]
MKSLWGNILLVAAAAGLITAGIIIFKKGTNVRTLEYWDPVEEGLRHDQQAGQHHKVLDFSLTDQTGKTITRADFTKSITVVDFFFTTCQGICPRMNTQMQRVYQAYKGNPEVKFISHTVNPENDSVPVLAAYAQRFHADADQWHFVTGDKPQLYNLARKSYLISDTEGDGGKEDFVHSQMFSLVDKEGYIRGIYDGTDPEEVDRLITDIKVLMGQYAK